MMAECYTVSFEQRACITQYGLYAGPYNIHPFCVQWVSAFAILPFRNSVNVGQPFFDYRSHPHCLFLDRMLAVQQSCVHQHMLD